MDNCVEDSASKDVESAMFEGLEEMSLGEDKEIGDNPEDSGIYGDCENGHVNLHPLSPIELKSLEFASIDAAYNLYNEYGLMNGFSIRRHKNGRNSNGKMVWYSFVCSCHGFREAKYANNPNRKREQRPVTRVGCLAEMRIRLSLDKGVWHVAYLNDDHNHQLAVDDYGGLLRSHRKMLDADIAQMNSMRESGINIPKIYRSFVTQSGGFNLVGFRRRDMYNQVEKQRRLQGGDANSALKYLISLRSEDPLIFWKYNVDSNGQLEKMFWCDGISQADYAIFGDVLSFDATYGKNKYKCPVVVFSGVNHHNQSCVFGCAIISDETEETYIWVLQQFLDAMKGKSPKSVITDGDYAMRNAIRVVFPQAHHRLCAWHLMRNATSNVGLPKFTQLFKICMLGDMEVDEFEEKWRSMVEEFGLQGRQHLWVEDLYLKKKMWATAYIRGKFFAGLRTTSRCEGLHARLGRFVHSRSNLIEFIQGFQCCLGNLRNNELEADFKSSHGEPVMQTPFTSLEKCASQVFTRAIFYIFRSLLMKSSTVKVLDCRETAMSKIFVVAKDCRPNLTWRVSLYPCQMELRCSCRRMESFGLPCIHIIAVMIHIDIEELPRGLVLDRWSKLAKQTTEGISCQGVVNRSTLLNMCRFGSLSHAARQMFYFASRSDQDFKAIREKIAAETEELRRKYENSMTTSEGVQGGEGLVRDPAVVRTKGCGRSSSSSRTKRRSKCGYCRVEGHNRKSCQKLQQDMDLGYRVSTSCADDSSAFTCYPEEEVEYCSSQWNAFGESYGYGQFSQ